MKVTMVMVSSLNGRITRGDDLKIGLWTSKEDIKFFSSLRDKFNLIVMGRKTYEAVRNEIELKPNKLRIVLTKNPAIYSKDTVKGSLEFTDEHPAKLLRRLGLKGYKNCLLVGGSEIATLFLKLSLVDELYLTIEPRIFGKGKFMLADGDFEAHLKLISFKKLNRRGTLNLRYKVQKVRHGD
jgi:dihydrofolate reductase